MKQISERALFERAARKMKSEDGTILHKHNANTVDNLMGGGLYVYSEDPDTNSIDFYTDYEGFIAWCRESGVLKEYEEVV